MISLIVMRLRCLVRLGFTPVVLAVAFIFTTPTIAQPANRVVVIDNTLEAAVGYPRIHVQVRDRGARRRGRSSRSRRTQRDDREDDSRRYDH